MARVARAVEVARMVEVARVARVAKVARGGGGGQGGGGDESGQSGKGGPESQQITHHCVTTLVSLQVRKIKVPFFWLNSRCNGLHMLICE